MRNILCLLAASMLGHATAANEADASNQPLSTAKQVHALTLRESSEQRPIRLRGIITYISGISKEYCLQDATGGVMMDWPGGLAEPLLEIGMEVEIDGHTTTNPPTPRVRALRLTVIQKSALPSPRKVALPQLLTEDLEGSLVEFTAMIRYLRIERDVHPPRLTLEFGPVSARINVWVSRWSEADIATYKPGSKVRVRGVLMRWKTADWLPFSTFAVAHDPTWLELLSAPKSADQYPLTSIPELLDTLPSIDTNALMKVRGTVTLSRPDQGHIIQSGSSVLTILPRASLDLRPGEIIEAVGFLGTNETRKQLEDALITQLGHEPLPPPVEIQPEDFSNAPPQWMDGRYVKMQGLVHRRSTHHVGSIIWLNHGAETLPVILPNPAPNAPALPAAGSLIEVDGVLEARLNSRIRRVGCGVSNYELQLQSSANIRTLRRAPWWTIETLLASLAVILLIAGASSLWALSLRKKVTAKSAELAREITARHDRDILSHERERLARDLHDTIEQTLTGASLQLDAIDATSSLPEHPPPSSPLLLARKLLDRSREELRRAVWDLTPGLLESDGLAAALRAMAAEQSRDGKIQIEVECSPSCDALPDRLATHICRIAQESTTNAIRHGHASSIRIELDTQENVVALSISDDGCGFDPATAPGISSGHFGLNGMKERFRRLGGRLEIHSQQGAGTRIQATCSLDAALTKS